MDTKFFSAAMNAVGLPVTVIDENTDFSKLGNLFEPAPLTTAELHKKLTGETVPEFSKDNPNCDAQCTAEWDATRERRPFSVVPRGWAPLAPRPNAEPEEA